MFSTCCKLREINRLLPSTVFMPNFCLFPCSCRALDESHKPCSSLPFPPRNSLFARLFNQGRSDFYLNASLRLLGFFLKGKKLRRKKGGSIWDAVNSRDWPLVLCRLSLKGHVFDVLGVQGWIFPPLPFLSGIVRQPWKACIINGFLPCIVLWYNFSRLCIIAFPVPAFCVLSLSYCHWRLLPPSVIGDVLLLGKGVGAAQGNSADIYFINLFLLFLHLLQL